MDEFIVGDKVRLRSDRPLSACAPQIRNYLIQHGKDSTLTVRSIGRKSIRFEEIPGAYYTIPDRYELVSTCDSSYHKEVQMEKKQLVNEQYTFTVSSNQAVDFLRISEECTAEYPLLLVKSKDLEYALIHRSLIEKSIIVDVKCPLPSKRIESNTMPHVLGFRLDGMSFSDVTKWARAVRNAPWPTKRKQKVTVHKVKI